jgi:type VI secretion system protein ImpF
MAKVQADQPLVPSVLDRLVDERPEESREPPKSRNQLFRDFKQSVRRDLENLLNTHSRCTSYPAHLAELEFSLVNYGIPDVRGADMGTAEGRAAFTRIVEGVIRKFEPRFQQVRVALLDNTDPLDRMLRFRIEALLRIDPAPEPVVFDTSVQPVTGNVEVKGVGR